MTKEGTFTGFRLHPERDRDIIEDLKHVNNKSERIKAMYRAGLLLQSLQRSGVLRVGIDLAAQPDVRLLQQVAPPASVEAMVDRTPPTSPPPSKPEPEPEKPSFDFEDLMRPAWAPPASKPEPEPEPEPERVVDDSPIDWNNFPKEPTVRTGSTVSKEQIRANILKGF